MAAVDVAAPPPQVSIAVSLFPRFTMPDTDKEYRATRWIGLPLRREIPSPCSVSCRFCLLLSSFFLSTTHVGTIRYSRMTCEARTESKYWVRSAEKDVSDGLLKFLQPVVKKCDERLVALLQSQAALAKQVDAFSAGQIALPAFRRCRVNLISIFAVSDNNIGGIPEIERIQEQKEGLHLGAYTAKLVASRKKLKRVEMM
eukprot:2696110-Rhodomonas_salina.1